MSASKFETAVAAMLLAGGTVFLVHTNNGLRDAQEKGRDQNRRMCADIGPTLPPCSADVGELVEGIVRKHPWCDPHRKEMIHGFLAVQKRCEEERSKPASAPGPHSPEENDNNAVEEEAARWPEK